MEKTAIVFAPHPDDETFGCGGTIARKLSEGFEVFVVLMTDGRHAYSKVFGIEKDPTPDELMRIRMIEVENAMGILGLRKENLIFLGFEDGTLKKEEEEVVQMVTRILTSHLPVEVYYTYEKDQHPDHRAAGRIVENSVKGTGFPIKQYGYSIWPRKGPFGRLMTTRSTLMRDNGSGIEISEFLSLKEMAIKAYKSQISIMYRWQKRPVVIDYKRFLRNKETFFIHK